MTKYTLIFRCSACALVLLLAACSHAGKGKLQGTWKSKAGEAPLKITDKKFVIDSDESLAEDYFVKADTIFTSFQGNQPYSKFIVQQLDEHTLRLLSPDSLVMEFSR